MTRTPFKRRALTGPSSAGDLPRRSHRSTHRTSLFWTSLFWRLI